MLLPILTSAFTAAGIPFWTTGEETAGLWPVGIGGGTSAANLMAVEIWVPEERLEEARAILEAAAIPEGNEAAEALDSEDET
jgi:hypothetical protein